ncbi:MAG: 3-hydroxyacyl-CoA dehydrogenase [Chloroflexi bacterium]|nr:MAG: 3-hydroxyacyl-CoA dehydrogenase [Chloroflexota bacterium]
MELSQKCILVTGGASGLGRATALLLSRMDAQIVIADRNADAGHTAVAEIGSQSLFVPTDVTDEAALQSTITAAVGHFGALHGAVNCAGIGLAERVLSRRGPHALASFVKTVEVNLIGTFNVLRLAAAAMAGNEPDTNGERGVIVNTASIAAFDGQNGQVAYAAAKGGIVGMTLPAARDLAAYGIRVVTIAPGVFDTPLLAALPAAARTALAQQVPFPPRLGQPAEYAALVAHIFENSMLNGEVIRLDGALRMPPR